MISLLIAAEGRAGVIVSKGFACLFVFDAFAGMATLLGSAQKA
jgi:hypothetical protein